MAKIEGYITPLGEVAYEAYRKESGGRSLVTGNTIPAFGQLAEPIQRAWEAAALAVVSACKTGGGLNG